MKTLAWLLILAAIAAGQPQRWFSIMAAVVAHCIGK